MKIPISIRGWWLSSCIDSLNHSTRSFLHPDVSKGVAASNTTPRLLPSGPKASPWLSTFLYWPRCSLSLLLCLSNTPCNCLM